MFKNKKIFTLLTIFFSLNYLNGAQFFTLGTGSTSGVYYPTGNTICDLINENRANTGIKCFAESTNGSVYNIISTNSKRLDFAIAQNSIINDAYTGNGNFKNKPLKNLRTIMSLYPELLTFVVKKDVDINKLEDIKNKRINIGTQQSGQKDTMELIFDKTSLDKNSLSKIDSRETMEIIDALRYDELDGYFYMVGHPNEFIKKTADSLDIDIVNISKSTFAEFSKIIKSNPYYEIGTIPANTYKGVDHDIETFGVKATLVTNIDVDDKVVIAFIDTIINNFEEFKNSHSAFKNITKKSLLKNLGAPLHPAAKAYYKTLGLL